MTLSSIISTLTDMMPRLVMDAFQGHNLTKGQRFRKMEMGDDSDLDEAVGGYYPAVRWILAEVERKGDKSVR